MRGLEILLTKYLDSNRSFNENFLVICSSCKRVRDYQGCWGHADGLWKITDTAFSHGLCPECAREQRAQIVQLVKARRTVQQFRMNHIISEPKTLKAFDSN